MWIYIVVNINCVLAQGFPDTHFYPALNLCKNDDGNVVKQGKI